MSWAAKRSQVELPGNYLQVTLPGKTRRMHPGGEFFKFVKAAEVDVDAGVMYVCQHCNASFDNFFSLRTHQNGNRRDGIPLCQQKNVLLGVSADYEDDASDSSSGTLVAPVITNPFDIQHEICRRYQDDAILPPPHPLSNLGSSSVLSYTGSVNYGELVLAFGEFCRWVLKSRSIKFWALYLKTRHLPNEDQREILQLVCKLFPINTSGRWCPDKRAVHYLLTKKIFWPLITYTYTCDLSAFKVPGLGSVTYTFVDPIFAWIIQARKLCKKFDLLFRYRETRRRGEQTWGSCVSCGEVMRQVDESGKIIRQVDQGFFLGKYLR